MDQTEMEESVKRDRVTILYLMHVPRYNHSSPLKQELPVSSQRSER